MTRRIGVFICECGTNISDKVDISKLIEAISSVEGVAVAERFRLLCSPDGRSYLEKRIVDEDLTHVVVAACSPREHQQTFMSVCDRSGLNPYVLALANIREQCAWITEDLGESTSKAIRMVKAVIGRVARQVPLEKKELAINPDVLVIGGGIAGLEASLALASPERTVYLVERTPDLGGRALHIQRTFPDMGSLAERVRKMVDGVLSNDHIRVMTSSELENLVGFFGNYEVLVREKGVDGDAVEVMVGAVILAIGADMFDCSSMEELGYGHLDKVITADELETMLNEDNLAMEGNLRSVAFVHCVGREQVGYCSGICCRYSLKLSKQLRELMPLIKVTHIFRDMCVPGKESEECYRDAIREGSEFVLGPLPQVKSKGDRLELILAQGEETASIEADMVVLSPAMVPAKGAEEVARMANVPVGPDGFFLERHQKLAPVMTVRDGICVVGCARGPASSKEAAVQARAGAGTILATLVPGRRIEPEVMTSHIADAFCQGCRSCIEVCSYGAISFDERRKIAVVNEVICRGCGNCVAVCPSGAASLKHSTFDQLYQEIMEAVR
ncbi:MAG: CoB--CoM heterodisulfide reductase iron-sulfur subunit A family protein [Methanomassiliicoccales archaeon]|nr:CoB--CoM heterodisulfide reductase iron-sulfur subunit A family protein [Methanomassiliicoccales archaeon]